MVDSDTEAVEAGPVALASYNSSEYHELREPELDLTAYLDRLVHFKLQSRPAYINHRGAQCHIFENPQMA